MPAKREKTSVERRQPPSEAATSGGRRGRKPLGQILVETNVISAADLERAVAEQGEDGRDLGEIVVSLGLAGERDVAEAVSVQLGLPFVNLSHERVDPEAIEALDEEAARENVVVPLRFDSDGAIVIAVASTVDPSLIADIKTASGKRVRAVVATRSDIERTIGANYRAFADVAEQAKAFKDQMRPRRRVGVETISIQADAPVVHIVNRLIEQGLRDRASDIHLEPQEDELRVRYRIDGTLHDVATLPSEVHPAVVSRIKILADMDIVERQRPQDGQFSIELEDQQVDIRAATTTTIWGEKVVLRLLSKQASLFKLTELGMRPAILEPFEKLMRSAYGMIIVAGPTGSGKTTTLYATLSEIDRVENNIMTIEDPVEYIFDDINQIQIRETAGVTFASGLKSILRQDPDVILVGEMRDAETARIGVQSALTGHFVLSSLHATDSTSAVYRFLDMGIEGFLVASSVIAVVAQRLVRRVCAHCVEPYEPTSEERSFYEASGGRGKKFVHGAGCNFCTGTGYLGRVGIFELLVLSDTLKRLIVEHVPHDVLRARAVEEDLHTLLHDAVDKIDSGQTTIGEVLRRMYVA